MNFEALVHDDETIYVAVKTKYGYFFYAQMQKLVRDWTVKESPICRLAFLQYQMSRFRQHCAFSDTLGVDNRRMNGMASRSLAERE